MALTITESWIRDRVNLKHDNLDDVKSLSLPGSYHEKIVHLGNSLRGFTRLKHLDLSRNDISILDGLDHLKLLETLNLYYNNVTNLKELYKLRYNSNLKEIDLRLNPVTKNEPDYRLFVIHMIPNIRVLDDRSVRDTERKAALAHFVSDQASKFDESPRKRETQDQQPERASSNARAELVSKLASRPSALADDDIALIDLISKADATSNYASTTQQKAYKAESYNSKELQDIPQPHSEKYAYLHNSSPENDQPKTREKNRVAFRDDRRNVAPDDRNIDYDDYHPFRTNGNFTPNPAAHARQNQNYQSNDRITGKAIKDYERYSVKRSLKKGEEKHIDHFDVSPRPSAERYDIDSPDHQFKANRGTSEQHSRQKRLASSFETRNESENGNKKQDLRNTNVKDVAFVNSSDFNGRDTGYRHQNQGIPKKILEEKSSVRLKIEEEFLMAILELVDKYWNGSKSLQKNPKFQSLAHDAISNLLTDHQDEIQTVMDLKKNLETRDREIEQLHVLMRQHEAEKEKLKKRLQNEDEIQRTIEMTDQDLRRLQEKIEEVQTENKTLKANKFTADNERQVFEQSRAENEELRQCKISLERENRTLAQQCEQHSTTLTQLQELTSMLQESHRSLVVTNDHLLQELDETRQRHQHEVQQLHWSYEQLKKTAEWLPRKAK